MPAITENNMVSKNYEQDGLQQVHSHSKDNTACVVKGRQSVCFARETLSLQALGEHASTPAFSAK
jgi:hypothetical protein